MNGNGGQSLQHYRSQTLNRLDLQRVRQQQQSAARSSLERHRSSLVASKPNHNNNNNYNRTLTFDRRKLSNQDSLQIYAPASIASPRELAHYKRPLVNRDSQHYAASSLRDAHSIAPSESSRSGRDSALGNLWEKFGTLRRRAKWSTHKNGRGNPPATPTSQIISLSGIPPPPPQTIELDADHYATTGREVTVDEIYAEGSRAIDGNIQRRYIEHQLIESVMDEGETRTLINESSKSQPDYQDLISLLTSWINDELAYQRIIVKDLQEDLYDGQILVKLIEKLHQVKLDIIEVTQNETTQKYKLKVVLDTINRILSLQARWARIRWSVEGIHSKNMVEIVHLLITLAIYYRAPMRLPMDVRVEVLVVQKLQGQLVTRSHQVQLTDSNAISAQELMQEKNRDAFDTLFEFAPEKLDIVKQSLVNFANRHLNKINMSCLANRINQVLDPEQFSDGLLLVFLIASLEDYFVPLGNLFTTATAEPTSSTSPNQGSPATTNLSDLKTALEPDSYINTQPLHKLHNVNLAFQLMEDAGISIRERTRPENIVNGDLKSVLRVLYALFSRYKHL